MVEVIVESVRSEKERLKKKQNYITSQLKEVS